ncbi:hypothetical protein SAY87_006699 [Trapa incisa]|uniref:Polyamine-modulated factor 1-binding protein 1 n=1 Tax=Trapa incisa TaxID=236973 RepID=A0AAN7PYW2_9MYRT|nr:hypothetical protein SAY87_006699 [Trapa incisa]
MTESPSRAKDQRHLLPHEADSLLSSLVYDLSQQMQTSMEGMLKMICEIDESSNGINEDIEKCKDSALEKKKILEEQKERFQKAAFTVLDMLNNRNVLGREANIIL